LLPDDKALPPPSEEYFEMETAKAFGYRWPAWLAESPLIKAKLVAHELEKGMRDSYHFEQRMDGAPKDGSSANQPAPWEMIRSRFFK
jgi:hypothetical protein